MNQLDPSHMFLLAEDANGWIQNKKQLCKYFHVSIPFQKKTKNFETFFWSELLLYKHFWQIKKDMGLIKEEIVNNWKQMNTQKYNTWRFSCTKQTEDFLEDENCFDEDMDQ